LSQAANTLLINGAGPPSKAVSLARRLALSHRAVDAIILMVVLAAAAICATVYFRTSVEFRAAQTKHMAAAARVEQLKVDIEKLEREIRLLKADDPKTIESYARSMGAVREGDLVIKIRTEEKESVRP
jgi:cell division protein FtsB